MNNSNKDAYNVNMFLFYSSES